MSGGDYLQDHLADVLQKRLARRRHELPRGEGVTLVNGKQNGVAKLN